MYDTYNQQLRERQNSNTSDTVMVNTYAEGIDKVRRSKVFPFKQFLIPLFYFQILSLFLVFWISLVTDLIIKIFFRKCYKEAVSLILSSCSGLSM